jgi:hypothetical protein
LKIPHGKIDDWVSFLDQEKGEELLSQQEVFDLANVLLNKSKILGNTTSRSAVDVANETYEEEVYAMTSWCLEQGVPVENVLEMSET